MNGITMYYLFAFILSFCLTIIYGVRWHRHFEVYFTLVFTLIPLVNLGYLSLSAATSLEGALLAQKIIYIGGCFLILFITFSIFSLCNVKVPSAVRLFALLFVSALYGSVLSAGYLSFFYNSVSFEYSNHEAVFAKEYGPGHTVFYVWVIACFLAGFGAIFYSFAKKKQVSRKLLILLFIPEAVSLITFFAGKLSGGVDLTPGSYVFAQIMYLLIASRMPLYNISETVADSLMAEGNTGFVLMDFRRNYLGSNEAAQKVFPEFLELTVDLPSADHPLIRDVFLSHLDAFDASEENNAFIYERGDEIYRIVIQYIYDAGKKRGYEFVITDDTKNQKYLSLIHSYNADLEKEVAEKTETLMEMHNRLILGMASMVESRDNSTGGHIRRTSVGVRILIDAMKQDNSLKLSEEFCRNLIKAAPMHDLGKIAVDDAVLRKPGRFTPEEFEKMKTHAAEGARIVHEILKDTEDQEFRVLAENVAHYHHERWDGSGYPEGRKGTEIPFEARIMAVADVYDALVSKRVYKEAMSFEQADRIILEGMGTQFDPSLRKYYESARPALEAYYRGLENESTAVPALLRTKLSAL